MYAMNNILDYARMFGILYWEVLLSYNNTLLVLDTDGFCPPHNVGH